MIKSISNVKVVVTGASGFVGREVVRQLDAAGFGVRAVGRGESLAAAMEGANAVIHLIGIIQERGGNTFEHIHVDLTRRVLEAAKSAGVRRYLHMSALGVRANARSRYHQTKWVAEESVRQSGLAWTIFRPSLIYGRGDQSINVLARLTRMLPFVPVLGSGNGKVQPVSVKNVAHTFVAALKNDATVGRTYELCGPVALMWNELYDQLMLAQHIQRRKIHLPLKVARLMAEVMECLPGKPPFTRDQLLMIEEDNVGDPGPAMRDLNLEPESFGEGLARIAV